MGHLALSCRKTSKFALKCCPDFVYSSYSCYKGRKWGAGWVFLKQRLTWDLECKMFTEQYHERMGGEQDWAEEKVEQ